ncbi:hypothetical protein VCUG_01576 [Vavraia culicis subsp. floridensis]|uniref:Uncharacterized protein n=1 Tax=Vavraia culicis (isolate floridensis) TaxID=948595 RepID=L2GUD5_VAVCU|nr:uncharacterized protein VCUG_01576 [Vavraia culicis subsp. floridensis]ELA46957.1 hypothetical protein VCUG_01576 [Vavraia culicis subsp. floridensis]
MQAAKKRCQEILQVCTSVESIPCSYLDPYAETYKEVLEYDKVSQREIRKDRNAFFREIENCNECKKDGFSDECFKRIYSEDTVAHEFGSKAITTVILAFCLVLLILYVVQYWYRYNKMEKQPRVYDIDNET